jgi:opacity protein-like surface antigen
MKRTIGVLALAASAVWASDADAESVILGKGYASLQVGAAIPNDVDLTVAGAITGSGKFSFDDGYAIHAVLGAHLTSWLAGELEFGYANFDFDKFTGSLTAGGTTIVNASLNGDIEQYSGMVNAIIKPLNVNGFVPYFGGGVGVVHSKASVNSFTVGSATFTGSSSSSTDFGAQFIAGVDYEISPSISMGLRYRFFWANTGDSETSAGTTTTSDDLTSHMSSAVFTFRF